MYTTDDLATQFNTSSETIRQWANRFKEFLSESTNPGKNLPRIFDQNDLATMTLVADLAARHMRYEDIKKALMKKEFREPPEMKHLKTADRGKLARLQDEVDKLQAALSMAIADGQQKAGKIEILEKQVERLETEIKTLNREIGRLEAS